MFTHSLRFFVVTSLFWLGVTAEGGALEDLRLFRSTDPLAARDEWGLLTPGPLNPTDFEPRQSRLSYYLQPASVLVSDPAYVGALQVNLRRLGYYSGPIDGFYSPEVSFAIARLQKAEALRVTGTLTNSVRRVLRLP